LTLIVVLVLAALAQAKTFTVLYNFTGGSDGGYPYAGVIRDAAGNMYVTAAFGSYRDDGTVLKIDSAGTETVVHTFSGSDGANPYTPVARDEAGNIYGTTGVGGSDGRGTVFKIDTAGNETVLHSFTGGSEGCNPLQGLAMDKAGNLYGTTLRGSVPCGSSDYGTIFKVDRSGNFTLLHSFDELDGESPSGGHLTLDVSGNLYGVATEGGTYDYGELYKLSKNGTLTVLHSFAGGTTDGCNPYGSVARDKAGNLYGTTEYCGSNNYGTIWKVSKSGKETVLHNFAGYPSDGCWPQAGVTRDSKGNLYGVAYACGANNVGALYRLSAKRKLNLLHSFDFSGGGTPAGEVQRTTKGTLFGTTLGGGTYSYGTVWKYVP